MNLEIRARKKQKGSINRKKKALARYEQDIEELYSPTTFWPYSPRTSKDTERLKEGLQKGIEQLRRELKSVHF
ncbi:hypothetical protein [Desulfosporosinus sp. FKB]|uniref:hypothetical protein n=1 Tax=Desulfosporosinus sp. FKB TaxID=1969835 RepID=UPI000B4A5394|nr:hypothetical protein [Desulfosporosinus sp. FKB]